jgi:hypothetical protein
MEADLFTKAFALGLSVAEVLNVMPDYSSDGEKI